MCHISLAFQYGLGCSNERTENGGGKNEGKIFRGEKMEIPLFLYPDDLVLFSKSEENLKVMAWHFV